MEKYDLTVSDINDGINRFLSEAYATATVSDNPQLIYLTAGPGAGKTALEVFYKRKFKERGERAFDVNSDKIAEYHPMYEDALEELPEECYRITRQFVRPATPRIFDDLMKHKISIINENTLDKGESDIALAEKAKKHGYKIVVNIMATDILESRISCFEREASMLLAGLTPRGCSKNNQLKMYNSFVDGIKSLNERGLLDEINVYIRGANISKPPVLRYSKSQNNYASFEEALHRERAIQREKILQDPTQFLLRIQKAMETITNYGVNEVLTENALNGLSELKKDFIEELSNNRDRG